ncbi:MAG: DNA topoisomerase IV [Bacteroidia bacterium]|nr:DNA topoisomerase IV [Bacteroidia bacterium]
MHKRILLSSVAFLILVSCYEPARECAEFKNGTFEFTTFVGNEERTTTFERKGELEIDYYEGKVDSSSIRWINDCEFIVQKLHPRNRAEQQAIHMKILTTSENSYTFEYGLVGEPPIAKGTAIKTN